MATLKGTIQLDTSGAVKALQGLAGEGNKSAKSITEDFKKSLSGGAGTSEAAKAFNGVRAAANAAVSEQKSALATLIATGQQGSKAFESAKDQLISAAKEAKRLDDALEQVNKEVDDVNGKKISIGDSLKSSLAGGLIGGGIAGIVSSGVGLLTEGIGKAISLGQEFETGMSSLSAVTGATGDLLSTLGGNARDLALQFGGSAADQLGVFQVTLSKIGPQLAQSPKDLASFAESVNLLSKTDSALGAAGAVDALTGSMLQFGVNVNDSGEVAREGSRYINVLAASAAVGSASVSQVAEAISVAGATAKNSNVSFEETNAAIQVLASKSLVGTQAGTALTTVMNKLTAQSKDGDDALKKLGTSSAELGQLLNEKGLGAAVGRLREAMGKLGTQAEKNALLNKLFGEGGQNAAAALLGGGELLKQFTEGVTGTNAATEQAAINMNTFAERMSRMKASVEDGFISAFQAIGPAVSQVLDIILPAMQNVFANLASALGPTVKVIGTVLGGVLAGALIAITKTLEFVTSLFKDLGPFILVAAGAFGVYAVATNAAAIGTAVASAAQAVFNAVAAANPIGVAVVAILAAASAYKVLADAMTVTAGEQLDAAEATLQVTKSQIKDNEAKKTANLLTQGLVKEYKELASKTNLTASEQARLREITNKLDQQYPSLIDQTKSFADNLKGVDEVGRQATNAMAGFVAQGNKLEASLREQTKLVAFAKRNVAAEELRDIGGFLDSQFSSPARISFLAKFKQKREEFLNALFKATNESQVNDAQSTFNEFLNANEFLRNNSEEQLKIIGLTNTLLEAQRAAVRTARGEQAELNKEQKAAPPTPAPPPEVAESEKTLLQLAIAKFEIKKKEIESEKELLQTKLQQQLVAGTISKEALDKQIAEKEVDNQKRIGAAFLETLKLTKDENNRVVAVAIKLDKEKDGENRAVLNDLTTQYNNILQAGLSAELTLRKSGDPLAATKAAQDAIKIVNEAFKANASDLSEGIIDPAAFEESAANLTKTLEASLATLREKLKSDPLIASDPKVIKAYEDTIKELEKRIAELSGETVKTLDKQATETLQRKVELNKKEIALKMKDEVGNAQAIRALLEENLAYETELSLRKVKSTGEDRVRETSIILREAEIQADAIAKKYADIVELSELESIGLSMLNSISKAFESMGAEQTAAREAAIAGLKQEEDDLKASLKNKELSIADFYAKQADLAARKSETENTGIPVLDAIKNAALETASTKLAEFTAKSKKSFDDFAAKGELSFESLGLVAAGVLGQGLAEAVKTGDTSLKAMLANVAKAAISALDMLIPVITAQYLGFLGVFGAPLAFLAVQGLKALLNSAVSNVGADQGVVGITEKYNVKASSRDTIPVMMRRGESAIVPEATEKNRDILEYFNATRGRWQDYAIKNLSREEMAKALNLHTLGITFEREMPRIDIASQPQVVVLQQNNEMLSRELKGLRKEIKNLKSSIRTQQEVHVYPHVDPNAIVTRVEARRTDKKRGH